jgi:hypothetical protein
MKATVNRLMQPAQVPAWARQSVVESYRAMLAGKAAGK